MFEQIKDFLTNRIFTSRLRVLTAVMVLLAGILITRLFVLQIVRGADYQENYDLTVEKDETIAATRGNIYDCNGKLLAYNELAYAITIEDNGTYENRKDRNKKMNQEISDIITHIEANGDSIDNNFGITRSSSGQYSFVNDSGTALQRFRADVFGHASIDDLEYNDKLGFDEAEATPDQIMDYLENGNIVNSVNMPACTLGPKKGTRISVISKADAGALEKVAALADGDVINKTRGDYAYTLAETSGDVDEAAITGEGIIRVRILK